jgi:addiction module HigA family antidote
MTAGGSVLSGEAGMRKTSKSSTTIEECRMKNEKITPVHPGVYLKELLDELGISQYRLAKHLGVPAMRINHVVNGRRPVTAEFALRLGRYFGQNPRYWLNLQARYEMDLAEDALSEEISREVQPLNAMSPHRI